MSYVLVGGGGGGGGGYQDSLRAIAVDLVGNSVVSMTLMIGE